MRRTAPVVGITMGDPAGIGPEIVARAVAQPALRRRCRPLVFGRAAALADAARTARVSQRFVPGLDPRRAPSGACAVVETGRWLSRRPGRPTVSGGRAAVAAIEGAVAAALDGRIEAVVTAPISKESIRKAGSPFPGHTEMLAALTGARDVAMMLVGGALRVSLATIHIPLREVPAALSTRGISRVITLTWEALAGFGLPHRRVAVCGLNPHAGERGIMGDEDRRLVAPAVRAACRHGIDAAGPLPADSVFHRALRGEFSAVVAMYHDQGLGPLKTVAFDTGVNLTLGLPIVRTSVDHGTAFDIAGRGVASPRSLAAAVNLAVDLAHHRRRGP